MKELVILGCGGHARSAADIALSSGIESLIFVDVAARTGELILGYPVLAQIPARCSHWPLFPGSGQASVRQALLAAQQGNRFHTLRAPSAHIGPAVEIGVAAFIGHFCHLGPRSRLGASVIVNTGAIVEHDCSIGDYAHISVNAALAGGVRIGQRVMVGAGATVIDGVSVCDDAMIGAGATVVADITTPGLYVGTPACRR
jgi:sugar O-acyltransferase (sialic acid O-acetyltransferase NeuD family)